jgi:ABC-2 type transport system permease protein
VLAVFLAVLGLLFARTLGQLTASGAEGVEFPMQMLLGLGDLQSIGGVLAFLAFWLVFLLTPALLTMRLFAEERSSGTLEMLLTAPLRDGQIVLSKFLACFAFYLVMWLPSLLYLPIMMQTGIDLWPVLTTYLGLGLAGAMLLSLGLLISSLVRSQLVAALLALFVSLIFVAGGFWLTGRDVGDPLYQLGFYVTVPLHFERNFSRGLLDTRQLVLYSSVTVFCLFLTVRSLESRRWR